MAEQQPSVNPYDAYHQQQRQAPMTPPSVQPSPAQHPPPPVQQFPVAQPSAEFAPPRATQKIAQYPQSQAAQPQQFQSPQQQFQQPPQNFQPPTFGTGRQQGQGKRNIGKLVLVMVFIVVPVSCLLAILIGAIAVQVLIAPHSLPAEFPVVVGALGGALPWVS
ncbi:hypothetical protein [Salinibacterium sp. PAMC 21357]|uniref:hypothetical protein n=1 Tax=Salinibacterium sp. PAMC 21357 TaxID=1112215 RepID=UPI00028895BC|nr:hypothetical protein [Salinibacterium sp. PAMC 21357]